MADLRGPDQRRQGNERGFAMLAAVIVLIGVGALTLLGALRGKVEDATQLQIRTKENMEVLADAVVAFAAIHNRLPCPALPGGSGVSDPTGPSDCNSDDGILPWRTLGLSEEQALDQWGRYLFYRADDTLTNPTANITTDFERPSLNGLVVCRADQDTCAADNQVVGGGATGNDRPGGAFVIISAGPAGAGAALPGGNAVADPTNTRELANAAGTSPFYDLPFNIRQSDGEFLPPDDAAYFDDIVYAMSVQRLMERAGLLANSGNPDFDLNDAEDLAKVAGTTPYKGGGRDVRAPTVGENPAGDGNAIVFGQQVNGKYTKLADDGTEDRQTSCVWIDQDFTLTTQTFRAYFVFQFFPGEFYDQTSSDKSTGDGFTFAILPGSTDTTDANSGQICGKAGHNMGLGFKDGIPMPKMAVEFDIYNNNYGDENALRHNHAAILTAWDTDYIGNGSGNNPPCGVGDYSTFGSENPCTFRRAADGFAAPNVTFLEERQAGTVDYVVDGLVAVPYPVRIEIERGCTLGCGAGTCGTGGTYMRTKVWIKCTADGCNDTTKDFTGDWTENSINYCHRDPSAYDASTDTTFDTIKFGFTMGSVGNDTGVLLYDLKASSN